MRFMPFQDNSPSRASDMLITALSIVWYLHGNSCSEFVQIGDASKKRRSSDPAEPLLFQKSNAADSFSQRPGPAAWEVFRSGAEELRGAVPVYHQSYLSPRQAHRGRPSECADEREPVRCELESWMGNHGRRARRRG